VRFAELDAVLSVPGKPGRPHYHEHRVAVDLQFRALMGPMRVFHG
jgi:hypothetical protein